MSLSKTHEIPDNGSMKTKATYPIDYALERVRQAVDHAEIEGDFHKVRLAVNDLEESIKAEFGVDDMMDQIADAKLCARSGRSL